MELTVIFRKVLIILFKGRRIVVKKKRHLVKPFVLCTADGTIVDIYGLYAATVNDAKIMGDVFENDVNPRELIKPEDIFIADRGFRDCIKIVKKRFKINVIIPPCTFFF